MEDENTHGGFFQFPLCLLAMRVEFPAVLDYCFAHGVCNFLDKRGEPDWRKTSEGRQDAMEVARKTIGFTRGDIDYYLTNEKSASQFVREWLTEGRKTCSVRLRTDIWVDTRNQVGLSERDFRVLMALYSAIGDKPMTKLGWQCIQWRAAGWLTKPGPAANLVGPLYPRGQIERSLALLLDRGFVFGATYRRGERFWTHRLDQAGLWKEIQNRKLLAKRDAQNSRRRIDAANSAALHAMLHPVTAPANPVNFSAGLPV